MKTFRLGGIHPLENKISASVPIQEASIPKKAFIPVSQHLGSAATPIVKKGDFVKVGQLIAVGESFISANIHSSVSGKVDKIDDYLDSSGFRKTNIQIEVTGDDWLEDIIRNNQLISTIELTAEEIIIKIKNAGIVGLGGATFPTHIKYMVPTGKKIDYLIINGVECEPYLTSDHRLMVEKPDEILVGIQLLKKALNVSKAIIGIEKNKADAIAILKAKASNYDGISIETLKVQYPQGGEKQLIDALLRKQVPSGKLPLDIGCVVNNVGTAFAVYEAVQKNKPLIDRIVTITGKTVDKPANYKVRIGTPISDLLKDAECKMELTGKVINGGPMMGKAITSIESPITKGTSGILLLPLNESKREVVINCIRCGKCTTVCPSGLEPHLISVIAKNANFERAQSERILDCIECGSCSYICPSNRPLLDYIRVGKSGVNKLITNKNKK